MLAHPPRELVFDGRDLTDGVLDIAEVRGYALLPCEYCGTERDPRLPFCCEFAAAQRTASTLAAV